MNTKLLQLTVISLAALLLVPLVFSGMARADDGGDRQTSVSGPGMGGYFSVDSQSTNTAGPRNEYNAVFAGNTFLMQFKNDSQKAGYNLQFGLQLESLYLVSGNTTTQLLNFSQTEFDLYTPASTVNGLNTFAVYSESDLAKFIMTVQVSNSTVTLNSAGGSGGMLLTPNELKVSFYIGLMNSNEGPMFQMMGPGNASVVLQLGIQAGNSTVSPIKNMNSYSQVEFTRGQSNGYFSWNNSARVNSNNMGVHSVLGQNDTLSLIYPFGMTIVHDPYIGISPQTITSIVSSGLGNIVIYAVTLAVSAALIGAAMVARRRR